MPGFCHLVIIDFFACGHYSGGQPNRAATLAVNVLL